MHRRDLLRLGVAGGALGFAPLAHATPQTIALVVDPADAVAATAPVQWALTELSEALTSKGANVRRVERLEQTTAGELCIVACGAANALAIAEMARAGVAVGEGPERLALFSARVSGRDMCFACGSDARGLMYALLELSDRLRTGSTIPAAFAVPHPIVERPSNAVRSVMRQFTSEPLDKAWFSDREMWPSYLGMLANARFNRLHLAFGLGYDMLQRVTDSYMLFLYPFLVDVPSYAVSVTNFTAAEREANLATLRFVSEEARARGLDFQLGVWMHGYELHDSPNARYVVQGLTPQNHAAYCRDALTAVLRACPAISSVALRIHGESGVAEGSYDFWQTVFDGVARCGRSVEIDLHAKGIDQTMIDRALATGTPVNLSPKYWAEHLGMPYHQAAIRDLELPAAGQVGRGLMTLSEGSRSFTRYGYADLLRDDRRYTVRHRVFAGTQKLLASGDPVTASAYAKRFSFCGSTGFDLMEPLTCRGRRGTGIAGTRRSGYADATLEPRWDWQKYAYWYRVWGRLNYNADADGGVSARYFNGMTSGGALASALAKASRILPIVTTAHLPSAACDAYWPEIYWNQPMAGEPNPNPYGDTPAPKIFQHVSPLDPQLFLSIDACAEELLSGRASGKYSPIEVAAWLDDLAAGVEHDLASVRASNTADARRLAIDARIQAGLGRFFAAKFRAGVLVALWDRTNDRRALDAGLAQYRLARTAWAAIAERVRGVYAADLSASDKISERGQWSDRVAAIDVDIAQLAERAVATHPSADARVAGAVNAVAARPQRRNSPLVHQPPQAFESGRDLSLTVSFEHGRAVNGVRCFYRHVNQAERWQETAASRNGDSYVASIPAAYTASPYPLQYYFVSTESGGRAELCPGLGPELTDEPYFSLVLR